MLSGKILMLRKSLLETMLKTIGFCNIRGHWLYIPAINSNSVVVDLGANLGEFSKAMIKKFKAKCYAVEPNQDLFDKISDVNVKVNAAITAADGTVSFFLSNNPESSSLINNFEQQWGNAQKVSVVGYCWKTMVEKLKLTNRYIDVLKIDVEGAELDLIESFDEKDIAAIKQITIEFHDWLNKNLHERTVNAIKKLTSFGFLCITDAPDHSWPIEALFVRKKNLSLNFTQKLVLKGYNQIRFLSY